MIFVLIVVLALAVLAPVMLVLRGQIESRGARNLAVEFHRTQLRELDRDLADNRILPAEHATAKLEVQRRLLAAAAAEDAVPRMGARWPVIVTLVAVPLAAAGLYAVSGSRPLMPSSRGGGGVPAQMAEEAALIENLRMQLSTMDPQTDKARQGYALLGTVEEQRGNNSGAAAAFRMALQGKFDPTIAARAAEATVRADGGVSDSSAALFRRALAAAPADAPWRQYVEQRLQEKRLPGANP